MSRRRCHLFMAHLLLGCLVATAGVVLAAGEGTDTVAEHLESAAAHFDAGHFHEALKDFNEALRKAEAEGDAAGQARALFGAGTADLALGRNPRGAERLGRATALAAEVGDETLVLRGKVALGSALLQAGQTDEAETLIEGALHAARSGGMRRQAAMAAAELGRLLAADGRLEGAITAYRESLADAIASGAETLAAKSAVNLARALFQRGQYDQGWVSLADARERIGALDPSHDRAYALISMGRLYATAAIGEPARTREARALAREALQAAADTAEQIGDLPALSYALGYRGQLEEHHDRYDESLSYTRQAVHYAQRSRAPEILYRWHWQTGRLLRALGDPEGAIRAYERAVYNLEKVRQDMASSTFREQVGPVYLGLADLLLEQGGRSGDHEVADADLREARDTMELLKSAELEDYFQDDCAAALKSKTTGIDTLAQGTVAIYPIILRDRLEILASFPGGMKRFVTPVSSESLEAEVLAFRHLLEKRTTRQYLRPAQQIYDWMIRPLEPALKQAGIHTLVFVPDGALRTIPLAALHDGRAFLVERYAVATTPGLTLTDPKPIERKGLRVLAGGLTEPVQGFPPLPAVSEELAALQGLYGGKVLQDQAFNLANVKAELTGVPYSVVHVASHGQFEPDVRDTFLLTYDGRLTMDALEGYMAATGLREQPVELLGLSACETAAGDDRAALGLAGVAVKAGARSALATLWYVNDRASSLLVTEFYRRLQDTSVSKAEALRQAQLSLLQDRRYRHPVYWSPFLLIGNWL
jgi:CHAT domain-containing protein